MYCLGKGGAITRTTVRAIQTMKTVSTIAKTLDKEKMGHLTFFYATPEIYEEQIPPTAFVRNGNDLLSRGDTGEIVLEEI